MKLSEKVMQALESRIPDLAGAAVTKAYVQALSAGSNVLEVVNGQLVESHPDGTRRVLKEMAPALHVQPGSKRKIRQ